MKGARRASICSSMSFARKGIGDGGRDSVERSTQLLLLTWSGVDAENGSTADQGRTGRKDSSSRLWCPARSPGTHAKQSPSTGHRAVGLRQAGNSLLTPRPHFTAPSCTHGNQAVGASDGGPYRQERRPTRVCRTPGAGSGLLAEASKLRAERERRARVITADGELQASEKLAQAAEVMAVHPAALQLRLLETVVEAPRRRTPPWCFPSPSNCSVFCNEQHRKHPGAGTTQPLCPPPRPRLRRARCRSWTRRRSPTTPAVWKSAHASRVGMPAEGVAVRNHLGGRSPRGYEARCSGAGGTADPGRRAESEQSGGRSRR